MIVKHGGLKQQWPFYYHLMALEVGWAQPGALSGSFRPCSQRLGWSQVEASSLEALVVDASCQPGPQLGSWLSIDMGPLPGAWTLPWAIPRGRVGKLVISQGLASLPIAVVLAPAPGPGTLLPLARRHGVFRGLGLGQPG